MGWLADWPGWAGALFWTGVTLASAYAAAHLVRAVVEARVRQLSARIPGDWDDALVVEIRRRVPFWSLLAGVYLSLPHWQLPDRTYDTAVNVITAFAVASVTLAAAAVATRLVVSFGPRSAPAAPVSALTQNAVRTVIILLGALVVVHIFVDDISPYVTAVGVGGLAVALAVQDPLSNFFAGIFMSAAGQVRIGDYVRLDAGAEGYVADVNWRATSIRLPSNNVMIVPNAKMAQAAITNFNQPSRDLSVTVDVGVHYLSDLGEVERVTLEVAKDVMATVPGGVPEFEPFVRYQTFGQTAINLSVILRGRDVTDQPLLKHELIKRLHARYARDRIVLPYPPMASDVKLPAATTEERPRG